VKNWRFAVMLLVLAVSGFAGGLVSGHVFKPQTVKADEIPDQIVAKTFTVADKNGNPRMGLTTSDDDNTPMLMLMDKKGTPRLILGMSDIDEPVISVADKAGKLRGVITALDKEGSVIELYDSNENVIWTAPK